MQALKKSAWKNNFHLLRFLAAAEALIARESARLKAPLAGWPIDNFDFDDCASVVASH